MSRPLLAGQEAFLRELTAKQKGITLAQIWAALVECGMMPVSLMTIQHELNPPSDQTFVAESTKSATVRGSPNVPFSA